MRAHLLTAEQYTPEGLLESYKLTEELQQNHRNSEFNRELAGEYAGRAIVVAMLEDSTRTTDSFLKAAARIGVAAHFRTAKDLKLSVGETLEDTGAMWASYYDAVVVRHGTGGMVANLASYADMLHDLHGEGVAEGLFVNAGDGKNEHPTQARLDGYTLWKHFGRQLHGLHHAVGGDLLHSRTVTSYVGLTSLFDDVEYTFITPPQMPVPQDITDNLTEQGIPYHITSDPLEVLGEVDTAYWARPQDERTGENGLEIPVIQLCAQGLAMMRDEAVILHAMPFTLKELAQEVVHHKKNHMYRQAANGPHVRAQLLREILDGTQSFVPVTDAQLEKQIAIYEREQKQQLVAA